MHFLARAPRWPSGANHAHPRTGAGDPPAPTSVMTHAERTLSLPRCRSSHHALPRTCAGPQAGPMSWRTHDTPSRCRAAPLLLPLLCLPQPRARVQHAPTMGGGLAPSCPLFLPSVSTFLAPLSRVPCLSAPLSLPSCLLNCEHCTVPPTGQHGTLSTSKVLETFSSTCWYYGESLVDELGVRDDLCQN